MTLVQLQHFRTLAYVLHYTKASEQLHIAQPSLSYSISELEKELGAKLFIRADRKICLTEYGQAFLPYAERALDAVADGAGVIRHMVEEAPKEVRLAYFHSVSANLVPRVVKALYGSGEFKQLSFSFFESSMSEILNRLKKGEVDLAFCLGGDDTLELKLLYRQKLYLMVSRDHPLASRDYVRFEDFAQEKMVMLEEGTYLRALMERIFQSRGLQPNTLFTVKECNAAAQYVSLHMGVAVLPMMPATETDTIRALPIDDPENEFTRSIYLAWPRNRTMPAYIRRIRNFILTHFESLNA